MKYAEDHLIIIRKLLKFYWMILATQRFWLTHAI